MTDREIIELVQVQDEVEADQQGADRAHDAEDEPEVEDTPKTTGEALGNLRCLRNFMSEKGLPVESLSGIEDMLLQTSHELCIQSKITKFFHVV